jgi:hypothetical protein
VLFRNTASPGKQTVPRSEPRRFPAGSSQQWSQVRTAGARPPGYQQSNADSHHHERNHAMIKILRSLGVTSDVAYLAGILSIGASIAAWTASSRMENAPGDKADRWGIYVGLWAPTFMALGNAIQTAEASD